MSDSFREPFAIEVTELSSGTYLVALSGEMDVATSPELTTVLTTIGTPARDSYRLLIDVSELTFIDSTGIKALISSAKQAESKGGSLTVVAPTKNIQRVFDIVRLGDLVAIVPSVAAAVDQTDGGGIPP